MYNVSNFLETCINSVLAQRMNEDIEVLMINDGSPDDSLSVAQNLRNQYEFITVISQTNKGLGGARNTGLENANGKYILFLDADDSLMPETLHKLINVAEDNELEILEFSAQKTDEEHKVVENLIISSNNEIYSGIAYYEKLSFINSACNKLYLKMFIQEHELKFKEHLFGEDFEFNTRVFYYLQRIMAINLIAASFMQSTNSITRNKDRSKQDKYLNDLVIILSEIQRFKEDLKTNLTPSEKHYFELKMTNSNVSLFYFMFKNDYNFSEMNAMKARLKNDGLFKIDIPIQSKKKDMFRKVMLRNFFLFGPVNLLKKIKQGA